MLLAQITNPAVPAFGSGVPGDVFASIIVTVWKTAITLGGLALLVMLLTGAFGWITAGGEKGKVEAARERITQSIIGLLILVGTVAITAFVGAAFKINLLTPTFQDNTNSCIGIPAGSGRC